MNRVLRRHFAAYWLMGFIAASTGLSAHTTLRAPVGLLGEVGFDQKLGAQVPLEAVFLNANGTDVRLGALLNGKAALLVPTYYRCANLCGLVRAGVAQAVARSGLHPARDFQVILVSFDPRESAQDARDAQRTDAQSQAGADVMNWNYLTGPPVAITAVMQIVGFRYVFDPRNARFDHDAGVVLLTPEGKVTQYLFGVQFPPETLRLALVNASKGRIGNVIDHFLLLCCDYDVSTGRYSLTIQRVMLGLGIATTLSLGAIVLVLMRRDRRRRARALSMSGSGESP